MTSQALQRIAIGAAALALLSWGYRTFWFLTDDAFIAFRYVSNHQSGHGWVWNPAPFLPVEGYTSFLWTRVLDLVWTLTGVEPPAAANLLSLLFGAATLLLAAWMVLRTELPAALAAQRNALLGLVLLGITSNRTFLAWLSSGLETALFNFAFVAWVALGLTPRSQWDGRWVFALATAATTTALTRPDGYLVLLGTGALLLLHLGGEWRGALARLAPAAPGLLVPVHVMWRRAVYGEWLPNTYFAKYSAPWPEAGARYAASFVLEYALWIYIGLALAALVLARRRLGPQALVTLGVVAAHGGYYTFVIGGDHFEYRVYSHLVPLVFASLPWVLGHVAPRPALALAAAVLTVVASWPLPWLHWIHSKDLHTRAETTHLKVAVAPHLPPGLRGYGAVFDDLQAWLIDRSIGMRHQEHKVFYEVVSAGLPSREEGARIAAEGRPVMALTSVGVAAWRLPNVAIIDMLGLNDAVVARTPAPQEAVRQMAHDRRPPEGYVECFDPNVTLDFGPREPGESRIRVRERVLDDATIRDCEARFLGAARAGRPGS